MDLQSGNYYWPTTCVDAPLYPSLEEDITCDVLVIGAGTSGAQCAHYLSKTGLDVVLVDKRKVGHGSTCTNTALIQYAGEKTFVELANSFGEIHAARHLKLCEQAIAEIEAVCAKLSFDAAFIRRDSLYYASYAEDVQKLEVEYKLLQKHGFKVDWWTEEDIGRHYPFRKRAALYYRDDAELNPYTMVIGLLEQARQKGVRIFEHTEITGKKFEKDRAIFYTKNRHAITARHVIVAAGYEGLEFKVEKNATLTSSYAVITSPVEDFSTWHKRTLIWESARPYIYMRTTKDNRVIIGGLDEDTNIADERDAKIIHKKDRLIQEFTKLFPNISVQADYYLGAFYGGTHDGLPIIGMYEQLPRCYFLLGYGDNGTVYNMVLARIIRDAITGQPNPNLDLYGQTRPILQPQMQ